MIGAGWAHGATCSSPNWSSAGTAPNSSEGAAIDAFVQGGGGLVASAERTSGTWLNAVSVPMGVQFGSATAGSPFTVARTAAHPLWAMPCP